MSADQPDAAAILQQHLDKARTGHPLDDDLTQRQRRALTADLTALLPLAGNRGQLLAEVYQRYSAIDREAYAWTKNTTAPRDDQYRKHAEVLRARFNGLHDLERALKA